MTKTSYIDSVIKGAELAISNLPQKIYVRYSMFPKLCESTILLGFNPRLLLSIDRRQSVDEAMDTVLLAEKYYSKTAADPSGASDVRVIGVDLSGDPRVRFSLVVVQWNL